MKLYRLLIASIIPSLIFLGLTFGTPVTHAEDEPNVSASSVSQQIENKEKKSAAAFLWNLQDADILSVINEVAQETGKNFAVDPRVNGKITLISNKPVRRSEVYQVFLSVLGMLGYSAIPSGDVVKIVPNMESGEMATKVATAKSPGRGDEVVVRVIPLQNVTATQLIPVLRPMLPQWSNIAAYTPGNVLIVVGRASNLKRIVDIVQDVDQASNSRIEVVTLHRASAAQVATVLNNLQNASRASGESPTVSIAADERSNSILLGGPKASRLRMRMLISQLDTQGANSAGNTEVVYLRYLEAKNLAPLLGKIAQNMLGKDNVGQGVEFAPPVSTNSMTSSTGSSGKSKADTFNQTNIQAEPSTNAIIITAPPSLMRALKLVITKLDIRPAQVMVEAIIAEIDESNLKTLGIQWGTLVSQGNGSNNQPVSGTTPTDFPPLGTGVFGIIPSMQMRAVLSALENTSGVDILSTPSVVVLDNQKARIEVGQDVPQETGQYATTGSTSTVTPFTTIVTKPVTLRLDVTPQINLGNAVRLKINLKNDTLRNPENPGLTPIINTSKIMNSVIINDADVLVVGGLISNTTHENVNKVPILGDVPVLGKVFQQKTRSLAKKNLVVFIKPVILHNSEEGMLITHSKYDYVRRVQANFAEDVAQVGKTPLATILPPWKNPTNLPKPFETPVQR
ncbi:MAG: type II secretion system protein GspD [Gammaproteobacteria bacterium RIFCSPHIGHO2_12_FULL_41_20]|nr:MAG: type II secretion system protein GspD [Gammaproteobacteria bacterium RIFCSPHIGHO2_12_FULL_41_20]